MFILVTKVGIQLKKNETTLMPIVKVKVSKICISNNKRFIEIHYADAFLLKGN